MLFTRSALSFENWTDVSKGATFIEFDWIGIDNQGQIGIFSSVTQGYIPSKVFSSYESYVGVYNLLSDRQSLTAAQIISKEPGIKDFWRDWAQKGLFAYDYLDIHRTEKFDRYDLIAIPRSPLLVGEIPEVNEFINIIPQFNFAFSGNIQFGQLPLESTSK
jgi:hypothetical protein